MENRTIKHNVSLGTVVVVVLVVLLHQAALAGPLIDIHTYADWTNEISGTGNITPIPTWESAGFEYVYPGESAYFVIPSLMALSDDEGHPALQLDFGTGVEDTPVIGGFVYNMVDDPDLSGGEANFSIKKLRSGAKPATYSLHLVDKNLKKMIWKFPIPEGGTSSDPWDNVTINFGTTPPTHVDPGFDLTKVSQINWDLRSLYSNTPYRSTFDHVRVTPEPMTFTMLALGGLLLRRRRRQG